MHRCYLTVHNKSHLKMLYAIRFLVLEDLLCFFRSVDSRAACRLFIYHYNLFDKGTFDTGFFIFIFGFFGFLIYWQPEIFKCLFERDSLGFYFSFYFSLCQIEYGRQEEAYTWRGRPCFYNTNVFQLHVMWRPNIAEEDLR